ncbi:hypothetical protein DE146DRAFT_630326 [Phaeosphaeria sp. MPI-PUGE-AT-0046c]|nr:hypothetical protein DE146DRAFT_630326 [Phaeosphaeria sp. MPI-PUGE-AT-0046c]
MAPQRTLGPVDVQEYPQTTADNIAPLPADGPLLPGLPFPMPTPGGAWIPDVEDALPNKTPYAKGYPPYNSLYNIPPNPPAAFTSWSVTPTGVSTLWVEITSSASSWTTLVSTTPESSTVAMWQDTTSCLSSTTEDSYPFRTAYPYENGPSQWKDHRGKMNNGGMYAAAAITPILVLAIIAGVAYFCMRKRKRQRAEVAAAAAQKRVEEMKTQPHSQPATQAYMAPPMSTVPHYSVPNVHLRTPPNIDRAQPIIYGPIPSGANGAYFTGIDTSDAISMTSANNLPRAPPIGAADNDSLIEPPPPPYRPRSAAPPSFTNSSRHSSIRASMAPPLNSRTQLIERSPFDDPTDDDTISELSGPTIGRSDDAMSAVSDCSYQNEPVTNRSSL